MVLSPRSPSHKIETICSSVKRFFFIRLPILSDQEVYIIRWHHYRGAGQSHIGATRESHLPHQIIERIERSAYGALMSRQTRCSTIHLFAASKCMQSTNTDSISFLTSQQASRRRDI